MDLVQIGWGDGDWIILAQVSNEPSGSIKCSETIEWLHMTVPEIYLVKHEIILNLILGR
jgi:hypothetical protein